MTGSAPDDDSNAGSASGPSEVPSESGVMSEAGVPLDLHRRVERLEEQVGVLQRALGRQSFDARSSPGEAGRGALTEPTTPPGEEPRPPAQDLEPRPPSGAPGSPRSINRALLWSLAVGTSTVAIILTIVAWDLGRAESGAVVLAVAALALAGSRFLRSQPPVFRPALDAGALFLAAGTALLAGAEWLPLPVAIVAAGLLWFSRKGEGIGSLRLLAHLVFALLALHYMAHLGTPGEGALAPYPLGVLGAMGVAAAGAASPRRHGAPVPSQCSRWAHAPDWSPFA